MTNFIIYYYYCYYYLCVYYIIAGVVVKNPTKKPEMPMKYGSVTKRTILNDYRDDYGGDDDNHDNVRVRYGSTRE